MLCIASFVVFLILGIFSATHRKLAAKAWYCLIRKVTFRPCDIHFNEELKGHLLGKIVFTHPRLAKFLDRWIDWFALAFVLLSLWSIFAVAIAGLNLFVYDTCDPHQAESCSLGGEACGVGTGQLTFWEGLTQGDLDSWAWGHLSTFGETVSRIPDRFRTWDASLVTTPESSYARPYDETKPTIVEIIDPSCRFCAKQFRAIKDAGLLDQYNMTYELYPIPNPKDGGYKFPHSLKLATVITMLQDEGQFADWEFITMLFTQKTERGLYYFEEFGVISEQDAWELIYELLGQVMQLTEEAAITIREEYSPESERWKSAEQTLLERQQQVDDVLDIRKIPTTLKDGRRFDRVVEF